MIKKHIVNIGHPRNGTTWLWAHAGFEPNDDKENLILNTDLNFDRYVEYYSQYLVSANFQTNLWCVDREIIKFVHQHATHITFIVRNPFDFVERYFDWIYHGQDIATLTEYIISSGYVKYKNIVDRWAIGNAKFKVFFFEDLEHSPVEFLKEYMTFCQLPIEENKFIKYNVKVNANPKQEKIKINFTNTQIDLINQEIDQFQSIANRDLTHWKK
jgi:hypothetical protein